MPDELALLQRKAFFCCQNATVYTFEPDTRVIADGSTSVRNDTCKNICSVGGFGGPSINLCNGENFFQKAVLVRNIWKKK